MAGVSDIKSPCEKTASFGGGGKLCADKQKTGTPDQEIDLSLAPPPPGLFDDLVTLSGNQPKTEGPSQAEKLYQEVKDFPVRPMLGGAKGVKVTIKTDLL